MARKDWSHIAAVTCIAFNGEVTHFNSLAEAVAQTDIRSCTTGRLGYPERRWPWDRWPSCTDGDRFIFRDELGLTIPFWKLQEADAQLPPKPRNRQYHYWWNYEYDPATFRKASVPGIRKRRRGGRFCTSVRTFADRRENDFINHYDEDCLEYRIKARPCRGLWALPNS